VLWRGTGAAHAAEQKEFVQLFADLMERSYVSKIELYGGEKIRYAGESVEGEQATVRTKIVTKQGTEVLVDYRMHRRTTAGSSMTSSSRG